MLKLYLKEKLTMKYLKTKIGVSLAAMGASVSSFAEDYTGLVTAAQAEAEANVGAGATAVIGVAIVLFGIGALLYCLKR